MSAVSIRLPDDVSTRLQDLAQRTGRSKTFYMVEAIREHLDDLEDVYLAEQRLTDLAPTGTFYAVKRDGIPCDREARSDLKRGTDCKPTDGLVALVTVRPQIRTAQQDSIRSS